MDHGLYDVAKNRWGAQWSMDKSGGGQRHKNGPGFTRIFEFNVLAFSWESQGGILLICILWGAQL